MQTSPMAAGKSCQPGHEPPRGREIAGTCPTDKTVGREGRDRGAETTSEHLKRPPYKPQMQASSSPIPATRISRIGLVSRQAALITQLKHSFSPSAVKIK